MHNHDRKSNKFEGNWACGHIISKLFDFRSIQIFWSNGKSASEFDFHTVFRPGVTNQNADTLSRIPKTEDVVLSGQTQVIKALTTQAFAIEQEKDEYCRKTRKKYESYMRRNENISNDINESKNDSDTTV